MNFKITKLSIFITLMLLASFCYSQGQEVLKLGDVAPTLKSATWLKGDPVESYQEDRVYVVEFWATWCGPCIRNIPHLTEIAKRYSETVTVVGVSIWDNKHGLERSANVERVKKFVDSKGDEMDYVVALDSENETIANEWMIAAGCNGIPTAFIVDRDGKIAWLGHPIKMEAVLDQVLEGIYDNSEQIGEQTLKSKVGIVYRMFLDALKSKQYQEGYDKYLEYAKKWPEITSMPEVKEGLCYTLLHLGDERAVDLAKGLYENEYKDNPMMLNFVSYWILATDEIKARQSYKLGLEIAMRANELSGDKDPYILDTVAFGYFKLGQRDKAIEVSERAISIAKANGMREPMLKTLTDNLLMFQGRSK